MHLLLAARFSHSKAGEAKSWSCRRRIGTMAGVLAFVLIEAVVFVPRRLERP
ncbi:MAG TPA: hypothetical protein VH853_18935 [Polyangia bacterium]|jgi:hypothetical protein|nr:hypothetical protein [Polyangia bacterium]